MIAFIAILCGLQAWSLVISLLNRKDIKLMATRAELDALLTNISDNAAAVLAAVADLATTAQTANADLLAAIQASGTTDFASEVATAQTANDNLTSVLASIKAVTDAEKNADPGPQPVAGS